MRNLLLLFVLLGVQTLSAQVISSSNIEDVTVFRNNASITSISKVSLPAGPSEVIITDVSTYIQPNSLQVRIAGKNVTLLSAVYENNYINDIQPSEEIQSLKDALVEQQNALRWAKEQKQIFVDLENALKANIKLGGTEQGYDAAKLGVFLDTYKAKQYEYNKAYLKHEREEKEITKKVNALQAQLNEANATFNKPSGVIRLQVSSVSPVNASFECNYVINGAGWSPVYDLRSEGTQESVTLTYKANVYQNSGYNWDKVDLTISTGNPSQNNNRPILTPLYLNLYRPVYAETKSANKMYKADAPAALYGNMAYELEDVEQSFDYNGGYAYDAQVAVNQLNVEFAISLPQSIPSDGKYHMIGMEEYELRSTYVYHTVPKLDKGAFLLARVTDWGALNLLPGNANIFFEGAYVGESSIDPNQTSDTLLLSMGRDEGIKVKRKQLTDYTSTKFLGSNKKETFAYEIEVRNTKGYAIDIEILDQVPVSQNKEITVEVEELSEANYSEEIGKVEWNLRLKANETKVFRLVYSVKYPKDQSVSGL